MCREAPADVRLCDEHARLGVLDQQDWIANERLFIESKKKESPFLTRKERFKNDFLRRVVPWEKITVSLDSFPYHIDESTKNLLVECTSSHLKHKKFTSSYGSRLASSSERILLESVPGTKLFRERLVRALAHDLQVPLLVLDSSVLAHDFVQECASEIETDDENVESETTSGSEGEDDNDASNEEDWTSSSEVKSDEDNNDERVSAEAIKKLIPFSVEEFEKRVSGESESEPSPKDSGADTSTEQSKQPLKKGDRVKYIGDDVLIECDQRIPVGKMPTSDGPINAYTIISHRCLSRGQRGEVYEVNGSQVAVILDSTENGKEEAQEGKTTEVIKPSIYWIDIQNIEHDYDIEAEDWYVAMEALCEILPSLQPIIVYFPDSSEWMSRAVPKSNRKEFLQKIEQMFDQLTGPIVLICGQNKFETGPKERTTPVHPILGHILPISLKRLTMGLKADKTSKENNIYKLFDNVICIHPPKEEEPLRTFNKQIEEDRRIVISRSNFMELQKVLDENELACVDLLHVNTNGVVLTKQKAEQVVGWARNHYLFSCNLPSVKGDRLDVPRESLEVAIVRLMEKETVFKKPSHSLKSLAKDEYENNFVSAVVPPDEVGVRFNDIGALEDVKRTLNELVILPMRRPELFSHGNLLRPCKGILLFGPPGTGKTLLAKALATEAGANFISITGSILTSKWFGDAEKLTKALFSFANRLAPVIIFVDEVDSLLGARGGAFEHEATRRMRNEFMAAWDGLRSKDSQRILILGATNRPFDLDDAVIRRLPRRIYVDLPDAANRVKILKIFLAQENINSDFKYDELANATEGYSGSDLKNLCIAAAYRPVQEVLEEEQKGGTCTTSPILRPLKLDDFIQAKAKVGASIAYDAASMNELRKWNEQYGEGGSRKRSPFGFGN
ncbi:Katanin p60 ATPase-containing subunit A1 [Acorus calamus]|uniref:Katanin p60 ATPase-containing subunit A1 n=1 Tax=Acorus calamus TaxID=4465 RepID=A0AAV9EQV5_ACOCL|nr:Katanin p60 ATPase-containing subunit A1 [Acorus calamus]